ncbi:insulin-like peptide receptor isoform X2 [Pectinophora gossypiella]|uniref:insulin-like peptide receptor isoform X2 n=1 Tax=Pectinophora gossypiella TaxID=13191 RepID=UPI00214ED18A|nr:insulin-like peptide receptor isoform X2 [Pectinophora gossypiella]
MRYACAGLAVPAVACALMLACARAAVAAELAPGICQTIDVRNTAKELQKLRGCRVIEGQLNIVLLERSTPQDFANLTFPDLREVTGYVKIYRMRGIRNLGDLFPNLSVVRGMQLFKDFAIVIFDCEDFEMLGLRSLTTIERGSVRIQNNDKLCYANTIDWGRIIQEGGAANNMIRSNYDTRLCGLCPNAQSRLEDHRQTKQCPADTAGRLLCWDDKHCQKLCPTVCGENACMEDGTCCHRECLGGCDGPGVNHCHVCRHFSIGYGPNRTCTKSCPIGSYELFRRCVSEHECRQMPPPANSGRQDNNQPRILAYKIFNHTRCVWTCPSGYMERGDKTDGRCEPCPESGCLRECPGGKIDSIGSTERFRGCTHVNGDLDISIRATGSNTMAVLEAALGEIRVINGGLKVKRSTPLVSLMFLKKLERIAANDKKGVSLYIFGNQNLELLWDWENHKPIQIEGRLYIHFNPKLCYRLIEDLTNFTHSNFTEMEVSSENNGYQAPCFKKHLNLSVHMLHKNLVILSWDMYCTDDTRKLLGYSIYYIAAEQNVTLYGQRDACSDTWNVLDITMDDVRRNNSTQEPENLNKIDFLKPCENLQPLFYPVTQLTPFTRYAAYVKTYTTLQDKKGAQSSIIYFKTLPGRPSPPQALTVESLDPQTVYIKWLPPALPNGTITMYHVEIQANQYNHETIVAGNTDYCTNPNKLATLLAIRGEDVPKKQEEKPVEVKNGTCACRGETKPGTRFNSQAEEERWESIIFENELQNQVYIKTDRNKTKSRNRVRTRRSIETSSLLSTLVILSGNTRPTIGQNYSNATEGGYVKAQYYELDGNTRFLTVRNMRHFTWYTVNVWACREQQDNETAEAYAETWCSERSYNTFRTMELPNADVVTDVRAIVLPSNKTLPEVNVTWSPPQNPNGFVVAYNVHYSRVEDSSQAQDVSLQNCIAASECKNSSCVTLLRNLLPGNYSVKVTPITVSGAGNGSAQAFIFIEERAAGHEWIWGVICGCVILILVLGAGIWYAKREFLQPSEANKLFASVNPEYVSTVYVPDEWEVPRGNIEFIRELGQGSFGMVYEGIAKNIEKGKPETRCAVKTVNEHATDRERIEFLNEASVMKAFDTFHVVRLLGVVSRGQPTLVVMELMEHGDLKTYLRSHRPDADSSLPKKDDNNPPTLQNILQMAIEIADGMAYLSAKKFVHRDLAARNCMVAGDLTVKVGDFGMTRDIYETDYYRKGTKGLLPVRWMSPESLKDGVFSSNSDIWSYGVVLWEMATLAMQPYQGLSNEQVVRYVVEGGVMERPEHCPDRLYELMRACWAHRPSQRPSFLQLVADLAPSSQPYFRHRSFFHSPQGQELYALQRSNADEEQEMTEVNVGAVATGSGSNLFGVSGRLASWVRELSSLRSRASDDAAAEPLQPAAAPPAIPLKAGPNGVLREAPRPAC